jgi:hypothetical protein
LGAASAAAINWLVICGSRSDAGDTTEIISDCK